MTFVSYSQNLEDVMLWRALKHIDNGYYVDVGAWSPNVDSVTKAFYLSGWRGINVEPNPDFYRQLASSRPADINLMCAIGDQSGMATMTIFGDSGLSTLDKSIADVHKHHGWPPAYQQVCVKRLKDVWEEHIPVGQSVHFLKIDVEGFEKAVISGNDWSQYRPWVVVVEATEPMTQIESHQSWESILLAARYSFVYADGLNRFYLSSEHMELADAFRFPPNYFDNFITSSEQEAKLLASRAESSINQAEKRAFQAEKRATQAESYASEILNSTSWRLTAPFRWASLQVRLVNQQGLGKRVGKFGKKFRSALVSKFGWDKMQLSPRSRKSLGRIKLALKSRSLKRG